MADGGCKGGDTKIEDGVMYQCIDSRWVPVVPAIGYGDTAFADEEEVDAAADLGRLIDDEA